MSDIQQFIVKANCVVLGVDMKNMKKYVLSTDKENIIFPQVTLDKESIKTVNATIVDYLHKNVNYVSDIELLPQLINLHSNYIDNPETTDLNAVYGFVVDYNPDIKEWYWIEFDELQPVKYSNVIFEVMQKLY